jgi:outer membrane protein assembly factor BamA
VILPRSTVVPQRGSGRASWARWAGLLSGFVALTFLERSAHAEPEPHDEVTVVPFVGGDSDVGFGGGVIASWALVARGYEPYLRRLEGVGAFIGRYEDSEGFSLPYTDVYALLELPHALPQRLKLRFRLAYTRERMLNYYGIGNASVFDPNQSPEFTRYGRTHPTAETQSEFRLSEFVRLGWGVSYTMNTLAVPEGSQLAQDLEHGSDTVRDLLGSTAPHHVLTFSYGLGWDSRSNLVNPQRGLLATVRGDWSPGGSGLFPYHWVRTNLNVRWFLPLVRDRLTLATRVMSDLLFGDPPFYELPRYDTTSAIGGGSGVRGIPAQRYWGKAKIIGNLELRGELFAFTLLGRQNRLAVAAFVDAGRVWSDYRSLPELDGPAPGIKYGLGAGPRWLSGKSFVLRFDVAWSKESSPLAYYLLSGHPF